MSPSPVDESWLQQRGIGRGALLGGETITVLSGPRAYEAGVAAPRQPVRHWWRIVAEAAAVAQCAAPRRGQVRADHMADIAAGKNR
ncbi:hypothetical protein [Mycobacterium sp.]|uniref:hypothetical protein n=1 Tax=Mycobacterium sp. TaxID=1785 RepID=UPI00126ABF52|nr:hypothetical protein [Mycobacterium sp.]KAA8954487.1 MAG: hypothetical protein F6Q13_17570 [Mycobacterium sp.]